MPRFFIASEPTAAGEVYLDADESRHAVVVFRVKNGDPIELFDGTGGRYLAIAQEVVQGRLRARIAGRDESSYPSGAQATLAVSVFRPEKMEILIQKATELGAHAIRPFISDRSVVKLSRERWSSKVDRWRKIVRESCKQCGLAYEPEIYAPVTYKEILTTFSSYEKVLLATVFGQRKSLAEALGQGVPKRILALVGPEGDFTPKEAQEAIHAGAINVTLGPLVLRSETAGIYLLSTIPFYYREVSIAKIDENR